MNELNIKIIAFLLSIVLFPFYGMFIEIYLLKWNVIDDYGYIGTHYLNWLYNLFFYRDGLYDAPNIFFYLVNFTLVYFVIKKIITFIIQVSNKK